MNTNPRHVRAIEEVARCSFLVCRAGQFRDLASGTIHSEPSGHAQVGLSRSVDTSDGGYCHEASASKPFLEDLDGARYQRLAFEVGGLTCGGGGHSPARVERPEHATGDEGGPRPDGLPSLEATTLTFTELAASTGSVCGANRLTAYARKKGAAR